MFVIGGGGSTTNTGTGTVSVIASYPSDSDTWLATADRQSGAGTFNVTAYAICANVS
jgi:hypothetical protein